MKVEINIVGSPDEERAVINVSEITDSISKAIELLKGGGTSIIVYREQQAFVCDIGKIYYIESVDNKSFVYTKDECFEAKYRLYELEDMLDSRFMRCSKSMICNIRKIRSVRADLNARMNATLLNGEEIVISRSYVKELKERLGM